ECDYGDRASEHRSELERIRKGVDLEKPLTWEPNEVLSLFRWSDFVSEKRLKQPEEFHLARAFCCCALLLIPDVHGNREPFDVDALAPLIESCLELGDKCRIQLAQFISWSLPEMEVWDEPYLLYALGFVVSVAEGRDPG